MTYQFTDSKGAFEIKTITVAVKEKEVQEPQKSKEPSKPQELQIPDRPDEGTRTNKPDSPAKPIKHSQTPQTGGYINSWDLGRNACRLSESAVHIKKKAK